MIARLWSGATDASRVAEYVAYLNDTGIRECRATPGYCGVLVLTRRRGDLADVVFMSLWESLPVIAAFAGPNIEEAVFYPRDDEFLRERELHVRHYELAAHDIPRLPRLSSPVKGLL